MIVGGGFGGVHLIRALERRLRPGEADVTLLDRNNYHLFTPLLYQVATGELPEHAVAYPLRSVTAGAGMRFAQTEVEAIDLEARVVRTAAGDVPYDHVVIAPGAVTNDFGIPGVREHAVFMKWLGDARQAKRQILDRFETAAVESDPVTRKRLLTFVIVGAGPVGVELASSLRDLTDHTLRPLYPSIDMRREVEIVLIDGADRVLPTMDARLSAIAQKRLDEQRVRTSLRTLAAEVRHGCVLTKDGAQLTGETIVWAGGVRTNPIVAALTSVPRHKDGRLIVDRTFRVAGRDDVFAFGDAAYFEQDGQPLPQLAQVAVLQARGLAEDLVRAMRGQPLVPYTHRPKGDLIALGRTNAGAQMERIFGIPAHGVVFGGFPAWTVWRVNYLFQLLGVRNRATLLMEWVLSYFFSRMVANT